MPTSDLHFFAYFIGEGTDGLHLAVSNDTIRWHSLNHGVPLLTPRLGPQRLMRDPHLTRGADGSFHLLWTTGRDDAFIGYAHSFNLRDWSEQRTLPVMAAFPGTLHCRAPESIYDPLTQNFLIRWSSSVVTQHGRTVESLYATHTRDFKTFTPTSPFHTSFVTVTKDAPPPDCDFSSDITPRHLLSFLQ
jgi:hypothetical protein